MKPVSKKLALTLHKETLRTLSSVQLGLVVGGSVDGGDGEDDGGGTPTYSCHHCKHSTLLGGPVGKNCMGGKPPAQEK